MLASVGHVSETAAASFWLRSLDPAERHALSPAPGDLDVDVAVIGAGFSGLWTAWFLLERDPTLRIAVVDRDGIGAGASGRNGGWASALSSVSLTALERVHGRPATVALQRALIDAVHDLHRVIIDNDLEPGATAGGTLDLIRSPAQAGRARARLGTWRRFGFGRDDIRWLDAAETLHEINATHTQGALYSPHCLALQPARLVHRLAQRLADRGVPTYRAEVVDIVRGRARTTTGEITAGAIILATEAYRSEMPGHRRAVIPLYSMMVVTRPLGADVWRAIGLHRRPTFDDMRNGVIYGQRTSDDRLAFGGRGAPYHYGSAISARFDTHLPTRRRLASTLVELFDVLEGVEIVDHWGGPLAMPRDLHPTVTYGDGIGLLGGYVGDGVTSSFLAGQAMADLVTGQSSDLTRLAWVGHRSPDWEPEPLRWIAINAMRAMADLADRRESRRPTTDSVSGRLVRRVLRR